MEVSNHTNPDRKLIVLSIRTLQFRAHILTKIWNLITVKQVSETIASPIETTEDWIHTRKDPVKKEESFDRLTPKLCSSISRNQWIFTVKQEVPWTFKKLQKYWVNTINRKLCKEINLDNLNKQLNLVQKDKKLQNRKWVNLLCIAIILCCMRIIWVKLKNPATKEKKLSISPINNKINSKKKCLINIIKIWMRNITFTKMKNNNRGNLDHQLYSN